MILEGICTTLNEDGSANIAPMGPIIDAMPPSQLILRPFQTSVTYGNLKRHGQGVFHVTDDVLLLAQAAVKRLRQQPALIPCQAVQGLILQDACRWYAFEVRSLDDSQPRTHIQAEVVASGRLRDFFGFCRAKHAVLEAAILATRVHLLPKEEILQELQRLTVIVQKTAGDQEQAAFSFLQAYLQEWMAEQTDPAGPSG